MMMVGGPCETALRKQAERASRNTMSVSNGFSSSGLIDFWRESAEAALDLSKNLTSAQSPGEFLGVWTKFAEGQYAAAEKYAYQLTGQTLTVMAKGHAETGAVTTAAATKDAGTEQSENAALLSEIADQVDSLSAHVTALAEKLATLESQPLKVKFSFGEPPHTGWTPSKVVVLGNDANGNLVELPSTIEEGGFRYTGTPSFWIAIG
jgi:hypothetical protein